MTKLSFHPRVEAVLTCGLQICIRQPGQGQEVAGGRGKGEEGEQGRYRRVTEVSMQGSLGPGCGGSWEL